MLSMDLFITKLVTVKEMFGGSQKFLAMQEAEWKTVVYGLDEFIKQRKERVT